MAVVSDGAGMLRTADGVPLKQALARATRVNKIKAFLLVAPLLVFILITFIVPILDMMTRSVSSPEVVDALPKTIAELVKWDGTDLPPEAAFAAHSKCSKSTSRLS